ncbi:MAG: TIGR03545 family protein [Planctomycetota bacterium]|nr:TIGR03545 family protein [Planctomycetota bacterium]
MVRWSYLMPRLLLLLAVLLFARFGVDPLMRWSLVKAGQSVTGAKVEIGDVRTQLLQGQVYVGRVAVADPRSPMSNLAEFSGAWLTLDTQALLHRRLIVKAGRLSGLRFRSQRDSSGQLQVPPAAAADDSSSDVNTQKLKDMAGNWFNDFSRRLQGNLDQDLESVRLAKELSVRWPKEYAGLQARVEDWKKRVEEMRTLYENLRRNPTDELPNIQKRLAQLDEIRQYIPRLRAEFDRLRDEMLQDRQAIDAARQHDTAFIRETLKLQNLDADSLSQFLLGSQLTQRIEELATWIRDARGMYTTVNDRPELNRGKNRGEDVVFDTGPQLPTFLVKSLTLDGKAQFGDQELEFLGRACNVTSQPKLVGQPATFQFRCRGQAEFQVEATLDQTGPTPREHLVINCPRLAQPQRVLGKAEQLALTVAPGAAHVWLQVDLAGEQLTGQVIWKQDDVHLAPVVDQQRTGAHVAEQLQAIASDIHSLQAKIDLTGTLQRPGVRMQSNLGPQLAQGIQGAVQRELDFRRDQLTKLAQDNVDKTLQQLEQLITDKQKDLLGTLQIGEQEMDQIKQQLLTQFDVPKLLQAKGLSLDKFLKR